MPYSEHIIDDHKRGLFRVNRRAFTSNAIFEAEKRQVFDHSWLYVGHVSEVPENGNFLRRKVGGRETILVRGRDGQVRVLLNSCSHRGNVVCREKGGKAARFTCFYHAWSFDLDGRLLTVPYDEAYSPAFDRKDLPLPRPQQQEIYRGMIFVKFSAGGDDLKTFLGNARPVLDKFIDVSGDDPDIVPGTQSYSMKSNWKLMIENSIDLYHGFITHQRYFTQFASDSGLGRADNLLKITRDVSKGAGSGVGLGNGHALIEFPAPDLPVHSRGGEGVRKERQALESRFGAERASDLLDVSRNLFIFPNLIFIANWRAIRTFYPLSPDYMEIDSWAMFPKGEDAGLRQARTDNFISFLGPAGFGTPDDVEALEGCQIGFQTNPDGWSDISRGMTEANPVASDEEQMRSFWREWLRCLNRDTPRQERAAS